MRTHQGHALIAAPARPGNGQFVNLVDPSDVVVIPTPPGWAFARSKANLHLINGTDLVDLVLDHYERLDSRYKGLLPLKRVYVP